MNYISQTGLLIPNNITPYHEKHQNWNILTPSTLKSNFVCVIYFLCEIGKIRGDCPYIYIYVAHVPIRRLLLTNARVCLSAHANCPPMGNYTVTGNEVSHGAIFDFECI